MWERISHWYIPCVAHIVPIACLTRPTPNPILSYLIFSYLSFMSQGSSSNCMSDRPTPPNDFKWPSFDQSAWKCFQITPSACKSFKVLQDCGGENAKHCMSGLKGQLHVWMLPPLSFPTAPSHLLMTANDCLGGWSILSQSAYSRIHATKRPSRKYVANTLMWSCIFWRSVTLGDDCQGNSLEMSYPLPATFMSALSGKYGSQRGRDWYSLALFGMVQCDLVWFGMVWYGVFMPALSRK